jgi:hypothetical protein
MKVATAAVLFVSHAVVLAAGFTLGVYFLPILIAPPPPPAADVQAAAKAASYKGEFRRQMGDSDALHWGEGTVFVSAESISLQGRVSPGPDYKLYLSPEFVETRAHFNRVKPQMARVGDVKTFENFILRVPPGIDPAKYTTVVVWCETFGMFISAARYR